MLAQGCTLCLQSARLGGCLASVSGASLTRSRPLRILLIIIVFLKSAFLLIEVRGDFQAGKPGSAAAPHWTPENEAKRCSWGGSVLTMALKSCV